MPHPKSRIEGRAKLKVGRTEAHDTGDHDPISRSKGQIQGLEVTRPLWVSVSDLDSLIITRLKITS